MIWFYRFLFLPCLLVALPFYLYRMWRRGGYRKSFEHRFGGFERLPAPVAGTPRIWLQAVSVGEVLAIGPLIDALTDKTNIEIVLTTTTSTGYAEARKRYSQKTLSIGIFPLDFWLFSRAAWKRIQPTALVLTESELWPEHLHQAKRRKVPAFLVNARISDRSFSRYQKVPKLAARMLRKFDSIFAASTLDQERLTVLGANPQNVQSHGSIKFDVTIPKAIDNRERNELRLTLGFIGKNTEPPPFVLLGSSTWPGEEAVLIEAQQELLKNDIDCYLLIVPRHAERAPEVIKLLNAQDLPWHQRSKSKTATGEIRIYLADTTGELAHLSQAADLAFIGKSLPPHHQGQTPIEAAGLGIPSLMGSKMSNFKDVSNSLVIAGAAKKISSAEDLATSILSLSKDPQTLSAMSSAGRNWHAQNRGSSSRIADQIRTHISA